MNLIVRTLSIWKDFLSVSVFRFILSLFQRREKEFDDYLREKYVQAKADFRELLKETKLITYR